jgi:hypothetical protein
LPTKRRDLRIAPFPFLHEVALFDFHVIVDIRK